MKIFLGLGSNIEPASNISKALNALESAFGNLERSPVYESESVGFDGDNFFNLVVGAETDLELSQLIRLIKTIEDNLGRRRDVARFSSRIIDIDILTYGDTHCRQPIVLPREEILINAYVLRPFSELNPQLLLPGCDLTLRQLWQNFDQNSQPLIEVAVNGVD